LFTEQLTQSLAVVGQIPSSNHAANTDRSVAGIDMSVIRRLLSVLDVGVVGGSANIQLWYESSANANMAGSTNLGNASGFSVQLLTCNTNNRVDTLEIRADQLPAGHRYVRPVVQVNTAASNVGLIALGGEASYKPANQFNVANTLDQGLVVG
jgi:hypothetical protein